jgi:hypothetical protein
VGEAGVPDPASERKQVSLSQRNKEERLSSRRK